MNFKKFLALGMAAIITANAGFAMAAGNVSIEPTKGVSIDQANQIISQTHQIDINHIAPNVDVRYIVVDKHLMKNAQVGGEALANVTEQTCSINMPVDQNFSSSYLGSQENHKFMQDVVDPANVTQAQLRTEFAVLHEASHCNLYSTERPFRADNAQVEENLNNFFKLSNTTIIGAKGEQRYDSVYHILHENYADALASMELIRKYGDTPDVLATLTKISIERHESTATFSVDGFDSHSTYFTMKEILKPETISKIMLAKSNADLPELALQIANKGTFKAINTYGDVNNIIGTDSLFSGVSTLTTKLIYAEVLGSSETSNINMYHEKNELYTIAKNTLNAIKAEHGKELSSLKTEKDVKEWISKNASLIFDESMNQVNYALGPQFDKNNDVVGSVVDYVKSTTKGEKIMSVAKIKSEGSSQLASLNMGDKDTVLANIETIRTGSIDTKLGSTPSLKR